MNTTTTQHTVEPWRIATGADWDGASIYAERLNLTIATCVGFDVPGASGEVGTDEAKANANRVVACVNACRGMNPEAVPELLEALKWYVREAGSTTMLLPALWRAGEARAKAAIAKAEGRGG